MAGLLPPGEKKYKVAAALGLLDIDRLEQRVADRLVQLRTGGGRQRRRKISEVAGFLEDRGEHTSIAWLSEAYAAIESREPAA